MNERRHQWLKSVLHVSFFDRFGGWSLEPPSVSGNISTPQARVWFNNKGYHAIPSYFNALSNNLLRTAVSPSETSDYGQHLFAAGLMFELRCHVLGNQFSEILSFTFPNHDWLVVTPVVLSKLRWTELVGQSWVVLSKLRWTQLFGQSWGEQNHWQFPVQAQWILQGASLTCWSCLNVSRPRWFGRNKVDGQVWMCQDPDELGLNMERPRLLALKYGLVLAW